MQLTPKYLIKIKNEDLHNYLSTIFEIVTGNYTYFQASSKDLIQNELNLWFTKWKRHESEGENIPNNGLEALISCPESVFPNIHYILNIICSLPISVASAERSFSTLRRVENLKRGNDHTVTKQS
ncbi:52 kDa repressor of the inhibitor of the protein kinase-like [Myzus persicae]|uniref:52 kDa repressor of the inhibitor of the protein kinase-like n=1 Tax=Myzus persicae TaxID=13164 RepID=UPI000B933251|nr:52 kDa repressor of the inhibitor of the protein kinase-like [Myzus persicae]